MQSYPRFIANTFERRQVDFPSKGVRVSACHYAPTPTGPRGADKRPAIVMGHGLSLTRDCGLHLYAEQFAKAGFHVFVFDYRGFGQSGGAIRDLISVKMQVEDYHAALAFARETPGVDARRVALWGTSYSGGIATQCAYEDARVQALVIQVPNLDNVATGLYMTARLTLKAPLRGLWLVAHGLADALAGLFQTKPVYVRCMGRSGEMAAYVSDESMSQINQIRGADWQNRLALRDFVRWPFRPIRHVSKIACPIQIFAADRDDLTPVGPALKAAKLAGPGSELHRYLVGHFGIYVGDTLQDAINKQIDFLQRTLISPT